MSVSASEIDPRNSRHHADDGGRLAIHADLLTDHAGVAAKSLLPIGVSEDDHRLLARLLLLVLPDEAAQRGFTPKTAK